MSTQGEWLRGAVFAMFIALLPLHATAQNPAAAAQQVSPAAMAAVQTTQVPNLVGQPASRVDALLGRAHLDRGSSVQRPSDEAAGTVIGQTPQADTRVRLGASVNIVVSSGPEAPQPPQQAQWIDVPNVVGDPFVFGAVVLARAHLRTGRVRYEAASAANGTILRQDPRTGTRVARDAAIDLVVSSGDTTAAPPVDATPVTSGDTDRRVRVPKVLGMTYPDDPAIERTLGAATLRRGTVVRDYDSRQPFGTVLREVPDVGTVVAPGSAVGLVVSGWQPGTTEPSSATKPPPPPPPSRVVPEVVGLPGEVATKQVSDAGFIANASRIASTRPEGTVAAQKPAGGTPAKPKSRVEIALSDGSLVLVPRVEGRTAASADALIAQAGLRPESSTRASSATPDRVIAQEPAAGTEVPRESTVRFVVAIAPPVQVAAPPPPPRLPDYTGRDIDAVRADPQDPDVTLGQPQRVFDAAKSGTILRQSVAPGTRPGPGTVVTFVVSRGPLWPWVVTAIVAIGALLASAAAAALWPPFRYRVLVKNHKVSASGDAFALDGPSIEMRVHVEHGGRTLNEDP